MPEEVRRPPRVPPSPHYFFWFFSFSQEVFFYFFIDLLRKVFERGAFFFLITLKYWGFFLVLLVQRFRTKAHRDGTGIETQNTYFVSGRSDINIRALGGGTNAVGGERPV